MSDEVKKISFGFSKLAKPKTNIILNNTNVKQDDSVQFIDCVEEKSIIVKNELPKKPDFLVIPLPKQTVSDSKRRELLHKILTNADDVDDKEDQSDVSSLTVSTLSENIKSESLEERAAREIIEDLKNTKNTEGDKQNFTVPLTDDSAVSGKEATLDDYENIPIDKFGFAMLRGMGWAPGKGIGKTEKVISAKQPVLRPKGLGLGADKVIKTTVVSATVNEPLKLVKGSFVRIIAGVNKDMFGEVIGFDDETGRLIVKMAIGGNVLTFNEFMVNVISKDDFNKNSKVINVKKYEEYKKKESFKDDEAKETVSKIEDEDDHRLSYKTKRESDNKSRESSVETYEKQRNQKRKLETRERSSSPDYDNRKNVHKYKEISRKTNHRSSSEQSPDMYNMKHKYYHDGRKKERDFPDNFQQNKTNKYYTHSSRKEYSRTEKYRSSSEEPLVSRKHMSRKESKRRSRSSSSADSSPDNHSKEKKSKNRSKKYSSSSDSSSDESRKKKSSSRSDYKKKCKKNKEKKKSRRRSRSLSDERKLRDKSYKKHKKSKF